VNPATAAPSELLSRVDFGRYDAEHDKNLLDYFVEVGTAQGVSEGKYLVIGRKGSGKTALFRHAAATLEARVVELDLEDYVFQVHKGLKESGVDDSFAYTASWRFAIAVSMFLAIRSDLGFWERRRGVRILRQVGLGPNGNALVAILDWLKRVRKVDLPSLTGVADLGSFEVDVQGPRVFDTSTARALEGLEAILVKAAAKKPITALIDRLDDAWNSDDESLRLIAGAVRAARQYAAKFSQAGPAPVIVFLRTDLWERIEFNDKNKTSQDTIYLDWTEPELAEVIDYRIHKTAGVPEGQGWATVFTREEMRQRAAAQKHMLKRALGRPRDIVAFASLARETALARGHSIIEKQDIYDAEVKYSKHLVDELRDEIEKHVSSFSSVINTLKALDRRTFTLAKWEETAVKNGIAHDEVDPVLNQLFEASAVGVHRAGGSKGGSSTFYRYQDRFLKPTETGALQVHLGLTKELGLTDA
jgi:hypothetical protein